MAIGPGKYNDLATIVRERARAEGVVLIVLRGHQGSGFSVQATPEFTLGLPEMLRTLADLIERDITP